MHFKRNGFTLTELLVVITIIAVLAGIAFTARSQLVERAGAAKRISDVRQAGAMLLAKASDTSGLCQYFSGGNGAFDLRPYFIVKTGMGLEINSLIETEIMSWDRKKLPPKLSHWNCRGINFKNVPTYNAVWKNQSVMDSLGRSANVPSLNIADVTRPGVYPLMIDSSTSTGDEIFRINDSADCVGLREAGKKANAFMLDGSVRSMGLSELKTAGFTKAYDNSTTPPQLINL
jgi:prepilin-type N-terminal cleavage/methylation domain-containing protein